MSSMERTPAQRRQSEKAYAEKLALARKRAARKGGNGAARAKREAAVRAKRSIEEGGGDTK